jgi:hypothetical protein
MLKKILIVRITKLSIMYLTMSISIIKVNEENLFD